MSEMGPYYFYEILFYAGIDSKIYRAVLFINLFTLITGCEFQ
jgi:hypothetical protein